MLRGIEVWIFGLYFGIYLYNWWVIQVSEAASEGTGVATLPLGRKNTALWTGVNARHTGAPHHELVRDCRSYTGSARHNRNKYWRQVSVTKNRFPWLEVRVSFIASSEKKKTFMPGGNIFVLILLGLDMSPERPSEASQRFKEIKYGFLISSVNTFNLCIDSRIKPFNKPRASSVSEARNASRFRGREFRDVPVFRTQSTTFCRFEDDPSDVTLENMSEILICRLTAVLRFSVEMEVLQIYGGAQHLQDRRPRQKQTWRWFRVRVVHVQGPSRLNFKNASVTVTVPRYPHAPILRVNFKFTTKFSLASTLPSVPRSTRSTPSPPPPTPRSDTFRHHSNKASKQRPTSFSNPQRPALDWSTSYQASASSSAGVTEESSSDQGSTSSQETIHRRGRSRGSFNGGPSSSITVSAVQRTHMRTLSMSKHHTERLVTHSESPDPHSDEVHVARQSTFTAQRAASPATNLRHSYRSSQSGVRALLPDTTRLSMKIPYVKSHIYVNLDFRMLGEDILLLGALAFSLLRFYEIPKSNESHTSIFTEILILVFFSIFYCLSASLYPVAISQPLSRPSRPSSPVLGGAAPRTHTESKRILFGPPQINKENFARIWMSDTRNYRDSDDGTLTALLLGPLVATALLIVSETMAGSSSPPSTPLPEAWLIEEPAVLANVRHPLSALEALLCSRRNLVQLMSLSSGILLVHLFASRNTQKKHPPRPLFTENVFEKPWLSKGEGSRFMSYVGFTAILTAGALLLKALFVNAELNVWPDLSYFDVGVISLFYQFTLYVSLRLARHGFTLGELGLVAQGATALFMEVVNLTIARIWPVTTPFIKTFRLPTPLLIFQLALIPGSLLTGFLLSPLLVLSRHIAQRPIKRLRFPEEKKRHRRILALAFYTLAALIVGGLIGMWTRWCLGQRDPWVWAVFWLLDGRKSWSRIAFLVYWGLLGIISVAGWNRQLARARRYRHLTNNSGAGVVVPGTPSMDTFNDPSGTPISVSTALANGVNVTNVNVDRLASAATELFDAADKRVPTLGRNARRKYFHGLAVVMLVPGIAFDPAFMHLSLNAAFALFVFAEYVRYFALYPFGAVVHLFLNEFLDHKDSGTAILSHFYLLTGCAGSLWLEGPSRILEFTGVLSLGVGDALASIAGRRLGRHRWSPSSSKTLEGSAAFILSVVLCAWGLRAAGIVPSFSLARYTMAVSISAGLEALSLQNDNLTLPLYMWYVPCVTMVCCGRLSVIGALTNRDSAPQHPDSTILLVATLLYHKGKLKAPDEQRRLNLPALQPIKLGDASSSTSLSTQFYVPQPPPTLPKNLGKRPSTATLGRQGTDILLPSSHRISTATSEENVSATNAHDVRQDHIHRPADIAGTTITSEGLLSESTGDCSTLLQPQSTTPPIPEPAQSLPMPARSQNELNENESLDWGPFIQAYAAGKWDPRHTPNPPQSQLFPDVNLHGSGSRRLENVPKPPVFFRTVTGNSNDTAMPRKRVPGTSSSSSLASRLSLGTPGGGSEGSAGSDSTAASSVASTHSALAPGSASLSSWSRMSIQMRRERGLEGDSSSSNTPSSHLPKLSMPLRGFLSRSMSDSSPSISPAPMEGPSRLDTHDSHHDFQAAAATMRLAGDGINVRPLALPSPEVELTDPFRGHTPSLALPWSHETQTPDGEQASSLSSNETTRKLRLNSFWNVLGDVIGSPKTMLNGHGTGGAEQVSQPSGLPTISGSPVGSPDALPEDKDSNNDSYDGLFPPISIPSASAPLPQTKQSSGDYFGLSTYRSSASQVLKDQTVQEDPLAPQYLPVFETSPASLTSSTGSLRPPIFNRTVSEPLAPKVTISESLPDPALDNETFFPRPQSEIIRPTHRKIREELQYFQRGYLIPPTPPNEWERQKALYKFNIVHTAKDANFDRIALLAKLVFNAKICLISLIDADEQWLKSEFGLGRECSPRDESLCGHTILQDSNEPLVILDTNQDWRFAKNPFVAKHPFARFYAGAPLRTAEGFNIGSLCIIDSEPRSEFGPRQRHTLKEFAAIVMRELELWRDKIQLRIRDRIQISMEQFTRECLEIDTQAQKGDPRLLLSSTSMEKIYDRAAKLVKRTLDVEGAILIDVSSFEEFDTLNSEAELSVLLYHSDPKQGPQTKPLTPAGFEQMAQFFKDFPDGKVSEAVLPACIRGLMPGNVHYALTVPILNIDKRPFAMLCAYNSNAKSKPYLEGHELSYLRAIGVIILSAVLKRRMILADKAKSLFISNISHELRTPLHGILAAAELLSGTDLTPNQTSFLSTVQACGTSLVETVNHVLDFTKLSGSTKAGGAEAVIRPARVDLAQLVEEATEGCWIGHRARHSSEIGSVYSPRNDEDATAQNVRLRSNVETAVDIGYRSKGWMVICEKGGIRRCLMNLLGNSLKFTTDGYVHVTLRQLPGNPNSPEDYIKLELAVLDSGKGISDDFLKNQLFQPFSQENPLQPGTGLGLAIVNSIVRSESVSGKIDVWSAENFGTEIRIVFEAQVEQGSAEMEDLGDWRKDGFIKIPSISLLGFNESRGHKLLKQVLMGYLEDWWHFDLSPNDQLGDILIVNEEIELVRKLIEGEDCTRPLIVISSARGDPYVISTVDDYERAGGFARIIFKPVGPTSLRQVLKLCIRILRVGLPAHHRSTPSRTSLSSIGEGITLSGERYISRDLVVGADGTEPELSRPILPPRSITYNAQGSTRQPEPEPSFPDSPEMDPPSSPSTTISVGAGGLLLKTSIGSLESGKPGRVLVVEDNSILRELLVKWLKSKGYVVHQAADGQSGVNIFKSQPIFEYVPIAVLDGDYDYGPAVVCFPLIFLFAGVGATKAIRRLEKERLHEEELSTTGESIKSRTTRLIALTGMSSREDKRRAFEAGVDGYLLTLKWQFGETCFFQDFIFDVYATGNYLIHLFHPTPRGL
ncbi:hypothetical protein K439DRAFT_1656912 [Ramaria rubella]|nr:hypothetical protein K439DRAFT_1656912 [Ramaria rubella]